MPTKCSFCREVGHNNRHCQSEQCMLLLDRVCSKAFECINTEYPINSRAIWFYTYLTKTFRHNELNMILIMLKRQNLISKTSCGSRKTHIASHIVKEYFYKHLLRENNRFIANSNDRRYITLYVLYWHRVSFLQAKHEVSEESVIIFIQCYYIDAIRNRQSLQNNINLQVNLKQIDCLEECFECAICMEDDCAPIRKVILSCNHSFCTSCVNEVFNLAKIKNKQPSCALCRSECSNIQVSNEECLEKFNRLMNDPLAV
jgi:hypothetical protein